MEALKLRQGQLHFFKWNHVFFLSMTLLPILRRILRPTTQGHSSHAKYKNSRKIIFVSYDTHESCFWVMSFFLMKLTSQIREMWIGIICIIGQMRILYRWELYHFNIRGPLIVGAALSSITSMVHIFLKFAWTCGCNTTVHQPIMLCVQDKWWMRCLTKSG